MGNLSEHFDQSEFACHGHNCCGHASPVSERLIAALEELHYKLSVTRHPELVQIRINSGFRCITHNRLTGSSDNSYHVRGMAADIHSPSVNSCTLKKLAETIPAFRDGGIGLYASFIHVDVRTTGPARW